jgi:hypothetical protein
MKVAVYALTSRTGARVASRGVSGERLRMVRAGTLAALVGDVGKPPAPTPARLRAYVALMERLAGKYQALLPVRFGTVMQDDAELAEILQARQNPLRSQLAHVRGRAQMTIRLVAVRPTRRQYFTGAEYLADRAREQSAASVPGFAPLGRAVARWVKDERVERRGNVVTIYHLIPRAAADRYAAAIEVAARSAGLRVMLSGPWPAHAFADTW